MRLTFDYLLTYLNSTHANVPQSWHAYYLVVGTVEWRRFLIKWENCQAYFAMSSKVKKIHGPTTGSSSSRWKLGGCGGLDLSVALVLHRFAYLIQVPKGFWWFWRPTIPRGLQIWFLFPAFLLSTQHHFFPNKEWMFLFGFLLLLLKLETYCSDCCLSLS